MFRLPFIANENTLVLSESKGLLLFISSIMMVQSDG